MEQNRGHNRSKLSRSDHQCNEERSPRGNRQDIRPTGISVTRHPGGKNAEMLYREACDARTPWDSELPKELKSKWESWEGGLPEKVVVSRSLAKHQEKIQSINLHAFGDASSKGVSAAVYSVTHQPSGVTQGLVAAKSRLAKKGLTIPRLELVAGHMATNLVHNVKDALQGFPITNVHCWLDSSVALHWIGGGGNYKQFVSNRVQKI